MYLTHSTHVGPLPSARAALYHTIICFTHLSFRFVEILACGCDETGKALQRLFIGGRSQQSNDTLMHDSLREHLQFEEFSDETDVAQRTLSVLRLPDSQVIFKLLPFISLSNEKEEGRREREEEGIGEGTDPKGQLIHVPLKN